MTKQSNQSNPTTVFDTVHTNDRVTHERWQVAQQWEQQYWLREQGARRRFGKQYVWRLLARLGLVERYRGDDHNHWWASQFNEYGFLPSAVGNAIEVGCGPYTNLRLIRRVCQPAHMFLSDPLIRTYVRFPLTMVREMYRNSSCYLDDHPLEDLPFRDGFFDLAVMINVLDHVRDATECMRTLHRILKPGGYVLIGQDLSDEADVQEHPEILNTGHPIKLDEAWFRPFLGEYTPIVDKVLSREQGRNPKWYYATLIFAGQKKATPSST